MRYIDVFNEIADKTLHVFKKYRNDISNLLIQVKEDKTLLTKADVEIQGLIVEIIKKYDKNANFIAEEKDLRIVDEQNETIWVIDPIDGTRPFTEPNNKEYCCAVGVLENGMPIAAMIFMPEMGKNQASVLAIALLETREIIINGLLHDYSGDKRSACASTTRERGSSPSKIEEVLVNSGVEVKNRTTSQSIDLLRTAIDISAYSDVGNGHFDVFYRERQKIWDGVPGMCFNNIVGKRIIDTLGNDVIPFTASFLSMDEPVSPSVIVAHYDEVEKLMTPTV